MQQAGVLINIQEAKMSGYPIKWVSISDDEREEKLRVFKEAYSKEVDQMISIPQGVRMPSKFVKEKWAEKIYNFNLRQDDIWIVTFPKCGTTVSIISYIHNQLITASPSFSFTVDTGDSLADSQ